MLSLPPGEEYGLGDPDLTEGVAALRSLMLAVQEFRQAVAAVLELTLTDTFAISYLAADGPLTAGELSERMGLAASSITALLDRLEQAGIITRERRPGDRRAVTAVITEGGLQVLIWARHWMEAALLGLGEKQYPLAVDMMTGLAENVRKQAHNITTAAAVHPADGGR